MRHELGPVAVIGELTFVNILPRRAAARSCGACSRPSTLDRDPGDISTIEDEGSVEEARAAVAELRAGLHST